MKLTRNSELPLLNYHVKLSLNQKKFQLYSIMGKGANIETQDMPGAEKQRFIGADHQCKSEPHTSISGSFLLSQGAHVHSSLTLLDRTIFLFPFYMVKFLTDH